MAKKNGFISAMDNLPWILKIILCLPALDFVWAVYRIVKGYSSKNMFILVLGIIWLIGAITIGWLVDLITMIFMRKLILA